MHQPVRVALHGFSDFERAALGSFFRLAGQRRHAYAQVGSLQAADLIVADGDRPAHAAAIAAAARNADTVFVGANAPAACAGRLPRPIDTLLLLRMLDALVTQRSAAVTTPVPAVENHAAALIVDALIVDDSRIAQAYLQRRLAELGLGSVLAADSAQALGWLARRSFAHVFIDLELGEDSAMDGLGLCQHIKRRHRHVDDRVPMLVMVSALHGELDRVRGTFAGCDHYLSKPVRGAMLRELLKTPAHGALPRPAPR